MPKRTDKATTKLAAAPDPKPGHNAEAIQQIMDDLPDDEPAFEGGYAIKTGPLEQEPDLISAVYYGPPGSGKTTDLCSVLLTRKTGDLLVINAEGGLKTGPLRARGIPVERIKVWPTRGERPNFTDLEALLFQVAAQQERDPETWCAIGIDSGTETLRVFLDDVVEEGLTSQRELESKAKAAGTKLPARKGASKARFQVDRDDYGAITQQFRTLLRRLKYLGVDIIITALERRDEDEDTRKTMYGPAVNPAISADLIGYADIVLHTGVERDETDRPLFTAVTVADPHNHAKDRYGVLPTRMVNPTLDRVIAYVDGELTEEEDGDQRALGPEKVADAHGKVSQPAPAEEKPARKSRARKTPTKTAEDVGGSADDEPPF